MEEKMQRSLARTAAALLILGVGSGVAIAQSPGGGPGGSGGPGAGGPGASGPGVMMLQQFDTNGDGKISKEEFDAGYAKMFVSIDTNKDGVISPEELAQFPQVMQVLRTQQAFAAMDKNNDGIISKEEFIQFSQARAAERSQQKFARIDTNNDGNISREEFANASAARFAARDMNDDALAGDEIGCGRGGGPRKGPAAPPR